ncbi:MAG: phosphatidylserine decarboxylase [Caldimicrobium sp.]
MIHPEGKPYITIPLLASGLAALFKKPKTSLFFLSGALALAYFFRNPRREPLLDPELVISPADGKVVICQVEEKKELFEGPLYRIGIFMRLWDVHINRSPVSGKVLKVVHERGGHLPVFHNEAFEKNEKIYYLFEREDGTPFWVVQIAGLFARRAKNFVLPGDDLVAGDPIGIIKFSSRVELFFPYDGGELFVKEGQRVFAGETVLAKVPLKT